MLEVGEVDKSFHDPGSQYIIHFFPVVILGDPVCIEHMDHKWVEKSELLSFPLAPTDRQYALYLSGRQDSSND